MYERPELNSRPNSQMLDSEICQKIAKQKSSAGCSFGDSNDNLAETSVAIDRSRGIQNWRIQWDDPI